MARTGVLAAALGLVLAGGGVAVADEPQVLEGFCPFPITHEFPKEHVAHAAPLPTTRAPIEGFDTGQSFAVITNELTGESVQVNTSATLFFMNDGTAYFRGSTVAFFDSDRGDIPAGVWLIVGSVHVTLDAGDHVVTATGGVVKRDICAELA